MELPSLKDLFYTFLFIIAIFIIYYIINKTKTKTVTYYIHNSNIDPTFKSQTQAILLKSPWRRHYKIKEVAESKLADINIWLVEDKELNKYHDTKEIYPDGSPIRFSLTFQGRNSKPRIYINSKNWIEGVKQSKLTLYDYREYVINHEFGHGLGFDHQPCTKQTAINGTCPVMYQSTRGCPDGFICGQIPNIYDLNKKIDVAYLQWT